MLVRVFPFDSVGLWGTVLQALITPVFRLVILYANFVSYIVTKNWHFGLLRECVLCRELFGVFAGSFATLNMSVMRESSASKIRYFVRVYQWLS